MKNFNLQLQGFEPSLAAKDNELIELKNKLNSITESYQNLVQHNNNSVNCISTYGCTINEIKRLNDELWDMLKKGVNRTTNLTETLNDNEFTLNNLKAKKDLTQLELVVKYDKLKAILDNATYKEDIANFQERNKANENELLTLSKKIQDLEEYFNKNQNIIEELNKANNIVLIEVNDILEKNKHFDDEEIQINKNIKALEEKYAEVVDLNRTLQDGYVCLLFK